MRIAIVVLAVVLVWLLLKKKSQAIPLPSADPEQEGSANPLPSQPVQPGPGDSVQAYDQDTIVAHDQDGNVVLLYPDGSSWNESYGGEQPLAPPRPN